MTVKEGGCTITLDPYQRNALEYTLMIRLNLNTPVLGERYLKEILEMIKVED